MKPTLIVLAAGMSSRYGGLKQTDKLGPNGETIIDYSVYDAINAGFGKVVFVIRKSIEQEFMNTYGRRFSRNVAVEIAHQELDMLPKGFSVPQNRQKPWGTAHAVWCCRKVVNEPMAVINADDFYGREAFDVLAKYLKNSDLHSKNYCMVGYRLADTLSEWGTVSRGVCTTNNTNQLANIVECTGIERVNNTIGFKQPDGTFTTVDPDATVSMNCWGFTPEFFNQTERLMTEFFTNEIANSKAEFYIPTVVKAAIEKGETSCQILQANAKWFGVTYPSDKTLVMNKLQQLAQNKIYPTPLWS